MVQPNQPVTTVLFDLDDTLIDWRKQTKPWSELNTPKAARVYAFLQRGGQQPAVSESEFVDTFNELSESSWLNAEKNGWRSPHFPTILQETIRTTGVDVAKINLRGAMLAFNWHDLPTVTLFPETKTVLSELKGLGYKLGLVTNAYFPMWMRQLELREYGIEGYFDAMITSGDTGWLKPHPAIFWRALGLLHSVPAESIFVGDSPTHDIVGAQAVGMRNVLHAPPGLDRGRDDVTPDYTITSLTDLLAILSA